MRLYKKSNKNKLQAIYPCIKHATKLNITNIILHGLSEDKVQCVHKLELCDESRVTILVQEGASFPDDLTVRELEQPHLKDTNISSVLY